MQFLDIYSNEYKRYCQLASEEDSLAGTVEEISNGPKLKSLSPLGWIKVIFGLEEINFKDWTIIGAVVLLANFYILPIACIAYGIIEMISGDIESGGVHILVGGTFVFPFIIHVKLHNTKARHKHEMDLRDLPGYQSRLDKIRQEKGETAKRIQHLDEMGIVPLEYGNRTARLLKYLQVGRADTLKEAINLLELEEHQERIRLELQGRLDIQDNKIEELENRVSKAEQTAEYAAGKAESAYWEALSSQIRSYNR